MKLINGIYVIFEGDDYVGKTTAMHNVAKKLGTMIECSDIIKTHHPGSTPLGRHIRKLVKTPWRIDTNIEMTPLVRQMLYLVDALAFFEIILERERQRNSIVLADRSAFISGLAYGIADGVKVDAITRLYNVVTPPVADRLYILQCDPEIALARSRKNTDVDHYDTKGLDFHKKVAEVYSNLLTYSPEVTVAVRRCVSLDNVVYVNADNDADSVADFIVDDLMRTLDEKGYFE